MNTLLRLKDFSLTFCSDQEIGGNSQILHNINLTIEQGKTHALVGESGSGKSVTAMSILRLLEDVATVQTAGQILFNERDLLQLNKAGIQAVRGNDIAMIFQEPMTSLNPVYTIGQQLIEPLVRHRALSREAARQEALSLLQKTGIPEPTHRLKAYPHQLSGGQRQRVMIAMALACRPALLIADEPTTALDVTIQAQILELINDLQQEFNMAVLLITHDLPLVRKVADSVSIMHQGKIVEQNQTEQLFQHPRQDYTCKLLNAIPSLQHQPATLGRPLVQLKDINCEFVISKSWPGFLKKKKVVQAVDNVNLTVRQGTTLGIIGESGSGKSTLAFCLLKLQAFQGAVRYFAEQGEKQGVLLSALSNRQMRPLRQQMQIVFQDPFSSLSPRMTIEQIVAEGLRVHTSGHSRQERRVLVQQALEEVELDPAMATRFPHEFSGGQRQRVAIARAIILKPKLLILDEPTSALDTTIQAQIIELLQRLQQDYGMTYVFITHDLRVLRSLADELVVMRNGKVVEQGMADRIFSQPEQPYTKELLRAAFYEQTSNKIPHNDYSAS